MKNMLFDDRLDSYKGFFDHAWAGSMMERADGTSLYQPVFDLCTVWRGIVNTHVLPWLMVQQVKAYADGRSNDPYAAKLTRVLSSELVKEMEAVAPLPKNQRARLQAAIDKLDARLHAGLKAANVQFNVNGLWAKNNENAEFKMALWGSQRLCFGGLYCAYEDFLTRCCQAVSGLTGKQLWNKLGKTLTAYLGATIRQECWDHVDMIVARNMRNAIFHSGGRIDDRLDNVKGKLRLVQGEIQILPAETTDLFTFLKSRASLLADACLTQLKAKPCPSTSS